MDYQTIKDKTTAVLANPRILTFTLIGTTTLLIGAFLFFGDDKEEASAVESVSNEEVGAVAATAAALNPTFNPFIREEEVQENNLVEQTGGTKPRSKKQKKTRRSKKQLARKSRRI